MHLNGKDVVAKRQLQGPGCYFLVMRSILITIIIIISQYIQITNKKAAYNSEKDWSYMKCVLTKKRSRMCFYSIEIMSSNMYHSLQ